MFSIDALKAAQTVVYNQMQATAQIHWPQLSLRTGAQVIVKHENHARPVPLRCVAVSLLSTG